MEDNNLDKLKKEKDKFINKVFYLGLKIALIFAIPAVVGVLVGKRLDLYFDTGKKIATTSLFITFIFSWVRTMRIYNKLSRKIKEIESDIKLEKQKQE